MHSKALFVLFSSTLALAACGGDDSTSSSATSAQSASTAAPPAVDAGATALGVADGPLGTMLTESRGLTIYGFTKDSDGASTCEGGCASAWPPVLVEGDVTVPDGVDASLVTTVQRSDGTTQLKVGAWPVYTFAGDAAPGDVNGQGSGGTWFVIAVDGSLVKDAAAAATTSGY